MKIKNIKNRQAGFTLIELMITVAIIAIISAIAIPSYSEYVRKSKRADAKVELMRIAQLQESYFVQNLSYAKNLKKELGGLGLGDTVKSEQDVYKIMVAPKPDGCSGVSGANACNEYTLTAIALGAQINDKCQNFILTHTGVKDVSATAGTEIAKRCWQ